jgi:D-inositol-3-phosphate glycosyltransferase
MKIIIIGPAYPLRGGIANFNETLQQKLLSNGIDTTIFSFKYQYPKFLFPGKTQFETGAKPLGINVLEIIHSLNPINWIRVARKINAQKPTIVLIRYWLPFFSPCLSSIAYMLNKNIKVIALADNVLPHEKRIADKLLTSIFLKNIDACITMSNAVNNDLKKFNFTKKSLVLLHPVYDIFGESIDTKQARKLLTIEENVPLVLFFGFIRKYKGLHLLLEALSKTKNKKIKLLIAGEYYEDASFYINIIEKNNLSERVILHTNYIENTKVKEYFAAANLVAQTYISATQSGIAQIAYHFEKPLLVTNVGGLGEIVNNNVSGYVCNTNAQEIANCLDDFFDNNRTAKFEKGITEMKSKFSWNYFVDSFLEFTNTIEKN